MWSQFKRYARHLPAILGVLLLFGAIYVVQREFRSLKVHDIAAALGKIPPSALIISFAWTVASYGVLTFYDRLGTIYAGRPVTYRRVAFASFCAYALAHNLGFAAVSGAAVRYRLYANWGLTPLQIGKVIAFCSLTFGLGGMVLAASILFFEPQAIPFFGDHLPHWALYAIGVAMLGVDVAYVTTSRLLGTLRVFGHVIELPNWRMALGQVVVATLDVAVTAAIFYALLPPVPGLTYVRLLAVYLTSYTAGLVATVPGGLGVFDSAMLFGLAPYLDPPTIVGAIVVFRLFYYIIPLFLAGSLFAGNEILMRGRGLLRHQLPSPTAQPRWSEPDFAVAAGTGAVALCAFLLLSLGVLEPRPDYSWIDPDFAEVASQAGQFVPSVIGAALMVLAAALSQRVKMAWWSTIALLLIAAGVTWARAEALWIPTVLLFAALLIAPFGTAFYRRARVLGDAVQPAVAVPLLTLIGCVLALALFEPHVRWLGDNSFYEVVLSPDVPNSLRVSVALTVALGLLALWRLLRPGRVAWLAWGQEARRRYAQLGALPPDGADGVVWGEADRAGIAFRRVGRVMLGLGDPVGAESDLVSAIWRMRDLAQQEGLDPAVWSAGPGLLKIYGDLGLVALPLGPDGLPTAQTDRAVARYLVCVAERDLPALLPLLAELNRHQIPAGAPL